MSERESLVAIHGAIDREIERNPDLRTVVAALLPAYRSPRAVGWYDAFEQWTREIAPDARLPNLDRALEDLEGGTPRPRDMARRLVAVATLGRVFPRLIQDGPDERLVGMLTVEGLVAGEEAARELAILITGPKFESLAQWGALLEEASDRRLVTAAISAQSGAPPCSGRMVEVTTPGGKTRAAQLQTNLVSDQVTFACACRFLDPVQWPPCSSFWCVMAPLILPPGRNPVYHEVVSLDCPNQQSSWWAETYLEFATTTAANGDQYVSYLLDESHTTQSDQIVVDAGWLSVGQEPNARVRVQTLKRVRFRPPFITEWVAAFMCAMGYGDLAAELMFNCARGCV